MSTGQELLAYMRISVLDDNVLPYLWSDLEILAFLNYAEIQACRRANLIIDSSTASDSGTAGTASTMGVKPLCTLPVIAGQATYQLSPKILQVKRCQLGSMTVPLSGPVSRSSLDNLVSGWMGTGGIVGTAGTNGFPCCFENEPTNTLTLIPSPSANDTVYLTISRLPLLPITLSTSPSIDPKYEEGICDWAAHLAFMKPDSDTINLNLAKVYSDRFSAQFGPAPNAHAERIRKTLSQSQRMQPRQFGS
jgi:hypothetical protein